MTTTTQITSSNSFNGTDTTAVVRRVAGSTVIGFRIWTDAFTGETRAFHILEGGLEAETWVGSDLITSEMWRSHAIALGRGR